MPAAESGRWLAEYARHHPRTAASLLRAIGQDADGSAPAYERVDWTASTASRSSR